MNRPAKGIFLGIILSIPLWIVIIVFAIGARCVLVHPAEPLTIPGCSIETITQQDHYQDTRKQLENSEYNRHAIDVIIETRLECYFCHDKEGWD